MCQRAMESFRCIVDTEGSTDSPGSSTPSSRTWWHHRKSFCLVVMLVLVSGGISAGLSVYIHQCNVPKTAKPSSPCSEIKNKTVNIIKGKKIQTWNNDVPQDDSKNLHQYKICKIQRTGTYFIFGHVKKTSVMPEKDSVVLFARLRKDIKIKEQTFNGSCRELTFAEKIDLEENSVLYLRFNFDDPDLEKNKFTILETIQCGNHVI